MRQIFSSLQHLASGTFLICRLLKWLQGFGEMWAQTTVSNVFEPFTRRCENNMRSFMLLITLCAVIYEIFIVP
jgi:hypothetical protein